MSVRSRTSCQERMCQGVLCAVTLPPSRWHSVARSVQRPRLAPPYQGRQIVGCERATQPLCADLYLQTQLLGLLPFPAFGKRGHNRKRSASSAWSEGRIVGVVNPHEALPEHNLVIASELWVSGPVLESGDSAEGAFLGCVGSAFWLRNTVRVP